MSSLFIDRRDIQLEHDSGALIIRANGQRIMRWQTPDDEAHYNPRRTGGRPQRRKNLVHHLKHGAHPADKSPGHEDHRHHPC